MTDSVIVRLEKAAILRVIHQEPALTEMFIAHLLGRTIRIEADLVDQLFNSSEKRRDKAEHYADRRELGMVFSRRSPFGGVAQSSKPSGAAHPEIGQGRSLRRPPCRSAGRNQSRTLGALRPRCRLRPLWKSLRRHFGVYFFRRLSKPTPITLGSRAMAGAFVHTKVTGNSATLAQQAWAEQLFRRPSGRGFFARALGAGLGVRARLSARTIVLRIAPNSPTATRFPIVRGGSFSAVRSPMSGENVIRRQSLFRHQNSLLPWESVPVPLRREFSRKRLNVLSNWALKPRKQAGIDKIPYKFPY